MLPPRAPACQGCEAVTCGDLLRGKLRGGIGTVLQKAVISFSHHCAGPLCTGLLQRQWQEGHWGESGASQFVALAEAAGWESVNAPSFQGDSICTMPAFILKLTSGNMVLGEMVSLQQLQGTGSSSGLVCS